MCDKLTDAGISTEVLNAVALVLKRIQTPSLTKTFTASLQRPVFSLIVGGLVGGMLINLIAAAITDQLNERTGYAVGLVAALALIIVIGNWLSVRRKVRKRSEDLLPSSISESNANLLFDRLTGLSVAIARPGLVDAPWPPRCTVRASHN